LPPPARSTKAHLSESMCTCMRVFKTIGQRRFGSRPSCAPGGSSVEMTGDVCACVAMRPSAREALGPRGVWPLVLSSHLWWERVHRHRPSRRTHSPKKNSTCCPTATRHGQRLACTLLCRGRCSCLGTGLLPLYIYLSLSVLLWPTCPLCAGLGWVGSASPKKTKMLLARSPVAVAGRVLSATPQRPLPHKLSRGASPVCAYSSLFPTCTSAIVA
jgi:hypothetical protein